MRIASLGEIERSVGATLSLVRRDASALQRLDLSGGGFWRSFTAALLVLPVACLYIIAKREVWLAARPPSPLPDALPQVVIELGAYSLGWVLLPVAMIFVVRRFHLTKRYVPFVVAWNWSNVIAALIALPPVVLLLLGLARPSEAVFLNMAATALALAYQQRVTQIALAIPLLAALAIPVFDLFLGLGLDFCASTLEQSFMPAHP
jgi:hypothetical protein